MRVGLIVATGAVIAFILSMQRGGWVFGNKIDMSSVLYIQSTTAAYAVLSMSQMANLLEARSETISVFTLGFFKNKFALGAIGLSLGILLAFMYVPVLSRIINTAYNAAYRNIIGNRRDILVQGLRDYCSCRVWTAIQIAVCRRPAISNAKRLRI